MSRCSPALPPQKQRADVLDDDLLGELPPLDGADGDRESEPDADDLDEQPVPGDDTGDPLDDTTGEDDAVPELDGIDDEQGSMLDAGASDELDVGTADLVDDASESALQDDHDDDAPEEDYGLPDGAPDAVADAGEEGPSAIDEVLSDELLPSLGQEEDDALDDDTAFFDGDFARGRKDTCSSLWEGFGPPLSLPPTRALALAAAGVVSAGRELVRVDLEGGIEQLPALGLQGADVTHVILVAEDIIITTEGGGLFVSRDDGATFGELYGWRAHVRPEEAAAGLDVAGSEEGGLWGRTAQGSLLCSPDGGERWKKLDVGGFVRAVAMDDQGRAIALVRALGVNEVLRRTEDGWARAGIPAELLPHGLTGAATVVARASVVAIALEGEGVLRTLDGVVWSRLTGTEAVADVAVLDATGAVVVALNGAEGDPQSSLLRIGADGEPNVVALWEDRSEGDAGVMAIAVDEAHEVVWVGGGFGVAAFQPRMRSR
jgi:hypothetical protein